MSDHFLLLVVFAFFVSLVFAVLLRDEPRAQLRFGAMMLGGFVAAGLVLGWLAVARAGSRRARLTLAVAALPTALTWSIEAAGLAGFPNSTRTLAALPLGLAAGWVFVGMLRYDADLDGRQIHNSRSRARSI